MSFSQAELDQVISEIVTTSITRDYGVLGNRKVERVFTEVQNAAAGVFISQQNAVFYVVLLAAQRLQQALQTEGLLIQDLLETVLATGRHVQPIKEISGLSNASISLTSLASAVQNRDNSFVDIEEVSAYQRFEKNTQKFLQTAGKNVVSNGQIVQTPSEARGRLDGLFKELISQHGDILRRTALLEQALEDFNSLNLSNTVSASIISNASQVLSKLISTLEVLSAEDRLNVIREITLQVLATRATVKGFGGLKTPTTFLFIDGIGQVFADTTHPSTPAQISSNILGPYPILVESRELDVTLDGDASPTTTIQLQGSFVARAESVIVETYDVGQPNSVGLNNNELKLRLLNYPAGSSTDINITLTTTPTLLVGTLVSDINAAVSAASGGTRLPLIAEPYAQPLRFSGPMNINATTSTSDADFTSSNPSTDFTTLGVKEGDKVLISDPLSVHNDSYFVVDAGGVSATTLICTRVFPAGPPPGVDEVAMEAEVGGALALRLRISGARDVARISQPAPPYVDYRLQALVDQVAIHIPTDGFTLTADPPEEVQFNSSTSIGLFPGSSFTSRRTTAQEVALSYNSSFQAAVAGVARTRAETFFLPTAYSGRGRSSPVNASALYASKFQGTGDLVSSGVDVTVAVAGGLEAGIVLGDYLYIVASATTADTGLFGQVTSVTDTQITASITGATTTTDVDIEVGPLFAFGEGFTARISGNNSINDGDYTILSVGPAPFQVNVTPTLPLSGALPGSLPHVFTLEVGRFGVRFHTLNKLLESSIDISEGVNPSSAAGLFFMSGSASAVGTTKYFQLPEFPKTLEIGDSLELTTTQYNTPSSIFDIVSLEASQKLIEVSPELPLSTPAFLFSQTAQVPFARIRKGGLNTYHLFKDSLEAWLEQPTSKPAFFSNLLRTINPLISNTNPTLSQLNDPKLLLQQLNATLTTLAGYIDGYEAKVVAEVDNLLSSYLQEGADRAVDLLLEARFTEFFGLDQDEVSYAGALQKAIKDVARNDLPVRKTNRLGRNKASDQLIAEYEEPNYEYDTSDIDDVAEPDFHIGGDVEFPGRSY